MPTVAIICAAGAGRRMGCPKALCHLGPRTFLQDILHSLAQAGIRRAFAMLGARAQEIIEYHAASPETPPMTQIACGYAVCPNWRREHMLETLGRGIAQMSDDTAVLHWPVDCVDVHPDDVRRLLDAEGGPIRGLTWDREPGHPLWLSPQAVRTFRNERHRYASLRDFVDALGCVPVAAAHPSLQNCNTPDMLREYEAATNREYE